MPESTDAIDMLTREHREVENLFRRFEAANDTEERTAIAHQVVHDLAVHGEIEELRFYPRLRQALEDGDRLAGEAVEEHVAIKETLNTVDSMTATDEGFDDRMRELIAEVRHHVQEEEGELFPRLRQALGPEDLRDLGERMDRVRALVPTRPHPKAPTSPAAKAVAGPPVALIDRVRDAIRGALDQDSG